MDKYFLFFYIFPHHFSQSLQVKSLVADAFMEKFQLKPDETKALRGTKDGSLTQVDLGDFVLGSPWLSGMSTCNIFACKLAGYILAAILNFKNFDFKILLFFIHVTSYE